MEISMGNQKATSNLLSILETDDQYALMLVNKMILTLLKSVDHKSKFAYKICWAVESIFLDDALKPLGSSFPTKKPAKGSKLSYDGAPKISSVKKKDWNELIRFYDAQVKMYEEGGYEKSAFLKNISKLSNLVGFDEIQQEALSYVYAISNSDLAYRNFFSDILHAESSKFPALVAMAMEKEDRYEEIARYFGKTGIFTRYGIIEYFIDDGMGGSDEVGEGIPVIESFLKEQLSDRDISDENMVEVLIGKTTDTDLTIKNNFPHLEAEAKRLKKIIKAAYKKGAKSVNVAIHGPTGSGKTEFVKALAKMVGMKLFAIGESEEDNVQVNSDDQKVGAKRMASLLRAQAILKEQDDVLLLMDEFEDFVQNKTDSSKQADPDSKIALNRILEENRTVTFYNCNDIGKFHDSFRGRFFTSLFVGYQPTLIRKNIWAHHLEINGLVHDDTTALSFARRYEAPPRSIEKTCEAVALEGGGADVIHRAIMDNAKMLKGYRFAFETAYEVPENYDIKLISSKNDIKKTQENLQKMSKKDIPYTLLIDGDKGTGKSTFAYYQAEKMVRSPYVADMREIIVPTQFSSPEGNLAQAFMAAADSNALLVIDNVDAMFKGVSAEETENLTEVFSAFMQGHKAPVILITKDKDLVDDSFRAFLNEEIGFTAMDEATHKRASKSMFGKDVVPFKRGTAIGDFAKTAKSLEALPSVANDKKVIERRIAASAKANVSASIGFHAK